MVDNGAHGATGYQPTATSTSTSLAAVAAACGLRTHWVARVSALMHALGQWLSTGGATLVVAAATERPAMAAPLVPYSGPEIVHRFSRALEGT